MKAEYLMKAEYWTVRQGQLRAQVWDKSRRRGGDAESRSAEATLAQGWRFHSGNRRESNACGFKGV
eukprot:2372711-Rhodomonas_salina.3